MTILLLEIPPELYKRLSQEAQVMGDSVEIVAQRLLEEQLGIAHGIGMHTIIREGQLVGTPDYTSFEQAKGLKHDALSD